MRQVNQTATGVEEAFPGTAVTSMSDREFSLFSNLIYNRLGIKMPPVKKLMLVSRLNKRLKACGFNSYMEYYNFICNENGKNEEFGRMIDAVTTNKTDFFREPDHFDILKNKVLPELTATEYFNESKTLNIWSAGCSTGQEAYTISMIMTEFFMGINNRFNILATDISDKVLQTGYDAIYTEDVINPIPLYLRQKYLLRGTGQKKGLFRITPTIREKVTFKRLNLMEKQFNIKNKMEIVFCRNVIIYFDKETQIELFEKIYEQMIPGGYLFIGSSETLTGINNNFKQAGPTVYKKPVE